MTEIGLKLIKMLVKGLKLNQNQVQNINTASSCLFWLLYTVF